MKLRPCELRNRNLATRKRLPFPFRERWTASSPAVLPTERVVSRPHIQVGLTYGIRVFKLPRPWRTDSYSATLCTWEGVGEGHGMLCDSLPCLAQSTFVYPDVS